MKTYIVLFILLLLSLLVFASNESEKDKNGLELFFSNIMGTFFNGLGDRDIGDGIIKEPIKKENIVWKENCKVKCINGLCSKVIGKTKYVRDIDGICKEVEKAKSLKNTSIKLIIEKDNEDDPDVIVEDYNYTAIKIKEIKSPKGVDIPINYYKKTYENNTLFNSKILNKEIVVNKKSLSQKRVLDISLNEEIHFGGNSTKLTLQDDDTEVLDDVFVTDNIDTSYQYGNGNFMYIDIYPGNVGSGQGSGYDTVTERVNISGYFKKAITESINKPQYYYKLRIDIEDCLDATTISAQIRSNSNLDNIYASEDSPCLEGNNYYNVTLKTNFSDTITIGFVSDSNITINKDTVAENYDWYIWTGNEFIEENDVTYNFYHYYYRQPTKMAIKFNTSEIVNKNIINSTLGVYSIYISENSFNVEVYSGTNNWSEETIRLSNFPNKGNLITNETISTLDDGQYILFNVTNSIDNNINNTFILDYGDGSCTTCSSVWYQKEGTHIYEPYLEMWYNESSESEDTCTPIENEDWIITDNCTKSGFVWNMPNNILRIDSGSLTLTDSSYLTIGQLNLTYQLGRILNISSNSKLNITGG